MGTWLETLQDVVAAVNTADLDAGGAPVRAALAAQDVQVPGVWVRFDGLQGGTLGCDYSGVLVTVFCAVATTDTERSLTQAQELLAAVVPIIPPMSDTRHVALYLPGGGTPATALSYTHQLIID